MEHLSGFGPLADQYDGFILDLWGVVHDGVTAFPHAVETLKRLKAAGKRTVLLSNAPRPNAAVQAMMRRMGIDDTLYSGILTSGEAVRRALRNPPDLWWTELGTRVYHLGPVRDRPILADLPFIITDSPNDADFMLNTGPDDHANPTDLAEFEAVLQACAHRRLKMICANPDLEVIRGGLRVLCAGALALRYQELDGDVRSMGKPDPTIYQPVLEELGLLSTQVMAVGDSLRTDIAGASSVNIAACWVLDGIHRVDLLDTAGIVDTERADRLAQSAGVSAVATIPRFTW